MTRTVSPFAVGPISGEAGKNHVRIFASLPAGSLAAGEKRMWGRVRYRQQGQADWHEIKAFRLNGNFDSSGVVVLQGLAPATAYEYQAGWVENAEPTVDEAPLLDWQAIPVGRFRTDGEASQTRFLFGSCCYRFVGLDRQIEDDRADKIFATMRRVSEQEQCDFSLFGGDQVYADSTYRVAAAETQSHFSALYRQSFSQQHISAFLRDGSTYMTLDDHEIENNWPAGADAGGWTGKYPHAIKAYQIYQASHSPAMPLDASGQRLLQDPDKFWYTFSRGPADFFVMDTRTERVLSSKAGQRQMISEAQEAAFTQWLDERPERVKVLVSAVLLFPEQRVPFKGKDAWEGFQRQRYRILRAMQRSRSQKLVVLSGDVHASLYASLALNGGKTVHSWTCSGLFWPTALMAFRWYRPMVNTRGRFYTPWGWPIGKVSVPGEIYSRNGFSLVQFDEEGANFQVYDVAQNIQPEVGRAIRW